MDEMVEGHESENSLKCHVDFDQNDYLDLIRERFGNHQPPDDVQSMARLFVTFFPLKRTLSSVPIAQLPEAASKAQPPVTPKTPDASNILNESVNPVRVASAKPLSKNLISNGQDSPDEIGTSPHCSLTPPQTRSAASGAGQTSPESAVPSTEEPTKKVAPKIFKESRLLRELRPFNAEGKKEKINKKIKFPDRLKSSSCSPRSLINQIASNRLSPRPLSNTPFAPDARDYEAELISPAALDELQKFDPYPLNSTQDAIAEALHVMICGENDEGLIGHDDLAQQIFVYPDIMTVAYTRHVFQMAYDIYGASDLDVRALRVDPEIRHFEEKHGVEIVFDVFDAKGCWVYPNRPMGLAMFDMDSTLINEEVIDELARTNGVVDAVAEITRRAMEGEIDFTTSLQERVAMLKGVRDDVWEILKEKVTIAEGAKELIAGLKHRGVLTGVISGGFIPMAEWLKEELELDFAFANHLLTSPPTDQYPYPHLTGKLDPAHPIVNAEFKRDKLIELAKDPKIPINDDIDNSDGDAKIPIEFTMAVGDGSNDLPMLGAAGLGIAWNAKATVQEKAPMRVNGPSLAELLYLLGPETKPSVPAAFRASLVDRTTASRRSPDIEKPLTKAE